LVYGRYPPTLIKYIVAGEDLTTLISATNLTTKRFATQQRIKSLADKKEKTC